MKVTYIEEKKLLLIGMKSLEPAEGIRIRETNGATNRMISRAERF